MGGAGGQQVGGRVRAHGWAVVAGEVAEGRGGGQRLWHHPGRGSRGTDGGVPVALESVGSWAVRWPEGRTYAGERGACRETRARRLMGRQACTRRPTG